MHSSKTSASCDPSKKVIHVPQNFYASIFSVSISFILCQISFNSFYFFFFIKKKKNGNSLPTVAAILNDACTYMYVYPLLFKATYIRILDKLHCISKQMLKKIIGLEKLKITQGGNNKDN